jgi:hypothetical protein
MKNRITIKSVVGGLLGAAFLFFTLLLVARVFSLAINTAMLVSPVVCLFGLMAGASTAASLSHSKTGNYKTAGLISTIIGLLISLPLSAAAISSFSDSSPTVIYFFLAFGGIAWFWGIALTVWGTTLLLKSSKLKSRV